MKTIFHVDMDAFFVSVEELFDPDLIGKPVVVGGKSNERGVVSAASYAARKFGVHSAMPLRTAYQLCPQAIFVEGHYERYTEYSAKVREILGTFTPVLQMASIDEAYLDMTGTARLHGPPLRAAHLLHQAIKTRTRLNCSIGIASSRLVAKVSSGRAKPNGVLWVVPGSEAGFLAPLDVRRIPGIGKAAEKTLHTYGIRKVGDMAKLDEAFLRQKFGQWGLAMAGKARGLDAGGWFDAEIGANEDPKSVSHEHTFSEDTSDGEQMESTLAHLSEKVGRRLREYGLHARTVQLKLRFEDFTTITRAQSLPEATQIDIDLVEISRKLFRENWPAGAKVRLLGVHASGFVKEERQPSLLDGDRHERWKNALEAADKVRDKFGESAVSLGTAMRGRFKQRIHENPEELRSTKIRPKPE